MSRPLWIIGDVHASTSTDADLFRLLNAATAKRVDLLFMGDLFVAWLGPERFWSNTTRPLLQALRRCRREGLRIYFVQGNRDYLTAGLADDVFDEVWTEPSLRTICGRPTWVLHGDGIDSRDRAYRAWRTLTRGPWANALLHRLPAAWGRKLPAWTARRLQNTNRAFKRGDLPKAAFEAVARDARRAGAKHCLMGHFHVAADFTFDEVEIRIVPGWPETRSLLVARDDRWQVQSLEDVVRPVAT
ncbi:MAG: metallophosphoesterase [Myxococcota bacterium]